jgi:hypothetical protein
VIWCQNGVGTSNSIFLQHCETNVAGDVDVEAMTKLLLVSQLLGLIVAFLKLIVPPSSAVVR